MTQFCVVVSTRKLQLPFYASFPMSRFYELRKLTGNLPSVFGSTCTCEQTFSHMKQNKSKVRSVITYVHLCDVKQTGISET